MRHPVGMLERELIRQPKQQQHHMQQQHGQQQRHKHWSPTEQETEAGLPGKARAVEVEGKGSI